MKYYSKQEMAAFGLTSDIEQYFFSRWVELFDESTLDVWQIRSTNVQILIDELFEILETTERVHAHHTNIRHVLDELSESYKNDIVIKKAFPDFVRHFNHLNQCYESIAKCEKTRDLTAFRRVLNVVKGSIGRYEAVAKDILNSIVNDKPTKFKEDLDHALMSFAIACRRNGFSMEFCRANAQRFQNPSVSFTEKLGEFLKCFEKEEREYSVYYPIKWRNLDSTKSLMNGNSCLIPCIPDDADEDVKLFAQSYQGFSFLMLTEKALDPYSARNQASKTIQVILASAVFYAPQKSFRSEKQRFLIVEPSGTHLQLGPDETRLSYNNGVRFNYDRTEQLLQGRHLSTASSTYSTLASSLNYHRISVDSEFDESRLVNLWIALESLIQDGGSNIIDRICTYVAASDGTRYIYRLLSEYTHAITPAWSRATKDQKEQIKQGSFIDTATVLRAMLDGYGGTIIKPFTDIVHADNGLLVHRLNKIWAKKFAAPDALICVLEQHNKNVQQQLRRIYRMRNRIVHHGSSVLEIRQLIQHLHSYYFTVVMNIVYDLQQNSHYNVADALEQRKFNYEHLVANLKEKRVDFEYLLNPALGLNVNNLAVWGSKEKPTHVQNQT